MPVMDGFETLTKLKSDPDLRGIPVIMLTAEAGRESVLKIARQGVRDFLVKPFKEELIIDRVGRVVDLKPKGGPGTKAKRFDDPISILVVDDKPAICELITEGLKDTPWTVVVKTSHAEAADHAIKQTPDVILVSLSLPESAGFNLFQTLRTSQKTKAVPVFGLCVKTAVEDQARAQQTGFTGVVTKPIDIEDLKNKVARSLSLDTSYKYFQHRGGLLNVQLPANFTPNVANEVSAHLRAKVSEAVDSGIDKVVFDVSQLKVADVSLIKLGLELIQLCAELSLKLRMLGSEIVSQECKKYEETAGWRFASSFDEAVAQLSGKELAAAA
jgi:two-component system cell cycle response regulator